MYAPETTKVRFATGESRCALANETRQGEKQFRGVEQGKVGWLLDFATGLLGRCLDLLEIRAGALVVRLTTRSTPEGTDVEETRERRRGLAQLRQRRERERERERERSRDDKRKESGAPWYRTQTPQRMTR
ncbi:hypothetical protein CIHG_01675 [Coccidioides immitis H538.4]|uniref:Uncharacterized protein n=3 Tax=Coccidioides immitis TaxID=5501 RepID=A0A0J8R7S2_COCIT|nr:hypothetical protein CIRG_06004 [Coccidioides immitis RMSCC 2394]KMU80475.1 hypothetical protein CISG_02326 [Coccidioides immitis RMSCC 3703]KMU83891.1 hypothetical protein CIHG_01675 [Coccidioides immitis H538.4]